MSEAPPISHDDRSPTIAALASIAMFITQLGGAVLGVAAIAYLIGRNYLVAYYGSAQASWILSCFTSEQIVREGIGITSIVAISFLLALIGLMNGTSTAQSLEKVTRWLGLVGIVPLVVAIALPATYLSAKAAMALSLVAGTIFALSAGATIGELVGRLRDNNSQWKGHHLTLILFVYLFAVTQAPSVSGRAQAEVDMNVGESLLPYISKDGEASQHWRLVRSLGDKFLIVTLSKEPSARIFKLVSIGEAWQVTSAKP